MSVKLTLEFATAEAAADALAKLTGTDLGSVEEPKKPGKAKETKAEATAQTKAATTAKGAPAAKAPSVDEVKAAILKWAGSGADQAEKVKEFVRSFGITKISDSTEAIRVQMAERINEAPAPEDPMA